MTIMVGSKFSISLSYCHVMVSLTDIKVLRHPACKHRLTTPVAASG